MRRLITASALLAVCLAGCAANKDFEKEILGHPAPESPSDTGWARTPPPPPPPPPGRPMTPPPVASAPAPSYAPPPAAPTPAAVPAPGVQAARRPATQPSGDARFAPKPFTPAPAAPAEPGQGQPPAAPNAAAAAPAPTPVAATPAAAAVAAAAPPASQQPKASAGERVVLTFQVGEYAHAEKAKELMGALEGKGFTTRMDQGKRNNRTFYKLFATKEGDNRAEVEGELLACGVTEPRLTAEQPAGAATKKGKADGAPKVTPAVSPASPAPATTPAPAATPAAASAPAPTGTRPRAPSPKQSGNIPPPVVEPAPPLPDGYVPPPKKSGS